MLNRSSHAMPQMLGSVQAAAVPRPPASGLFGSMSRSRGVESEAYDARGTSHFLREENSVEDEEEDEDMGFGLFDDGTPAPKSLIFEDGTWEETGMTTTYDVPGTKTLSPNNSTIKHKIAKIDFKNVIFSHIVVSKLRQVAFLKARLRNTSKITLLKGPLASFPRCSAGESFSLPLGVDPVINIAYPKPTVRRSQTGIFTKEDSNVFTRLKIEISNPRGLKVGGDPVRAGQSAFTAPAVASSSGSVRGSAKDVRASVYGADGKEVAVQNGKWGSAVATTKKSGEVVWSVKLNPGQGVRLALEYEATFPGGRGLWVCQCRGIRMGCLIRWKLGDVWLA
ncbi:hypothetical protein BKA65DRAFT_542010 [Rhexocercosporidium sp. MPI-PUGE-AT-0058]|nr:hypothetical protein BKA65DRAFT_542010 [Rhexocercosporidium sp. MPI-PUGE-AT-0058]